MTYSYDRTAASLDLREVLDDLRDLEELSDNLAGMEATFDLHFASVDTEVTSQFEVLQKSREGLEQAKKIREGVESLLKLYPEDKTAKRALADAQTMVERFVRHVNAAQKIITTLSKKTLPPALKKMAASAKRLIESRLVDPKTLSVIPWQEKFLKAGVTYLVVFRIAKGQGKDVDLTLAEETAADRPGVYVKENYNRQTTTAKAFADQMFEKLKGWPGMKGESEATESRASIAQQVASALRSALRRMGSDREEAQISSDNRLIEMSYRSNLPKEGERSVGEYRYSEMVSEEIGRARKVVDPALAPYKDSIKRVEFHDGEKSWIYVNVELK